MTPNENTEMRPATRDDAGAMPGLLRSVTQEGSTLPFVDGIDDNMIEQIWLGARAVFSAATTARCLACPRSPSTGQHVRVQSVLQRQLGYRHRIIASLLRQLPLSPGKDESGCSAACRGCGCYGEAPSYEEADIIKES